MNIRCIWCICYICYICCICCICCICYICCICCMCCNSSLCAFGCAYLWSFSRDCFTFSTMCFIQNGESPLLQASYKGHVKAVELLVEKKADLNIKEKVCVKTSRIMFCILLLPFLWPFSCISMFLTNMSDLIRCVTAMPLHCHKRDCSSLIGWLDGASLGCLQGSHDCVEVLVRSRCRYYDQEKCTSRTYLWRLMIVFSIFHCTYCTAASYFWYILFYNLVNTFSIVTERQLGTRHSGESGSQRCVHCTLQCF